MRLKVFRLKDGKLEYRGIREVQNGDIILEDKTSMAEVSLSESAKGPAGPTRAELQAARAKLAEEKREALIASLKRLHPDWTDRQIQVFLNPERVNQTWPW